MSRISEWKGMEAERLQALQKLHIVETYLDLISPTRDPSVGDMIEGNHGFSIRDSETILLPNGECSGVSMVGPTGPTLTEEIIDFLGDEGLAPFETEQPGRFEIPVDVPTVAKINGKTGNIRLALCEGWRAYHKKEVRYQRALYWGIRRWRQLEQRDIGLANGALRQSFRWFPPDERLPTKHKGDPERKRRVFFWDEPEPFVYDRPPVIDNRASGIDATLSRLEQEREAFVQGETSFRLSEDTYSECWGECGERVPDADDRVFLVRSRKEREERAKKILSWIERQSDPGKLAKARATYRQRYYNAVKLCFGDDRFGEPSGLAEGSREALYPGASLWLTRAQFDRVLDTIELKLEEIEKKNK